MSDYPEWMKDEREISRVCYLDDLGCDQIHDALATAKFTRFERYGEYSMIPWIGIETWVPRHRIIEVPLNSVRFIEYRP